MAETQNIEYKSAWRDLLNTGEEESRKYVKPAKNWSPNFPSMN